MANRGRSGDAQARQTRGIAIDELPPAAREAVEQEARRQQGRQLPIELGPDSPLRREVDAELANSRNSSRRAKSGAHFQQQLVRTHAWYRSTGRALIRQHHPQTRGMPAIMSRGKCVRPGTLHFQEGGAPCDFGGLARVAGKVRGILFDAKVITGVATYSHLPAQFHQLEELRDQQAMRGIGFLLLCDQDLGIAYLVEDLAGLLDRGTLVLRETPRRGATKVPLPEMGHRFPYVSRPPDFSPVAHYASWDWLRLLDRLHQDGAEVPAHA